MANDFHQTEWDALVEDECRRLVRAAVLEDLDRGQDWTTVSLVPMEAAGRAAIVARQAGVIAGLLATAFFVGEMIWGHARGPRSIMPTIVRTAEWTMSLLELAWLVVLVAAILATVCGFFVPRAVVAPPPELDVERGRARRAAWTANLTLVLPALTVIILNVTLWEALLRLTVPRRPVPVPVAE